MTTRTPRQTQTFLMRRLAEVGIQPNIRHGQNFLIDLNLLEVLAGAADLQPDDVVLEVGTGMGSLTALMAPRVAEVISAEIDSQLHQLAHEELIDFDNVTMLKLDALHNKNRFNSQLIEVVQERLAARPGSRLKLVANLPYNIATPVISNLLSAPVLPVTMTGTIQKELADRMIARPATRDYSALTIWLQSQCDIEIVRVMPPAVFWPRPKVHSAIVHLKVREDLRAQIPDREFFHSFVRAMFFHRRKFLRADLVSAVKGQLEKSDVDAIMGELELGPTARAEELDVATMLRLSEVVRRRVKSLPDVESAESDPSQPEA